MPRKFEPKELAKKMIAIQTKNPAYTEAALCAKLGVARDYILVASRKDKAVKHARKVCQAIREQSWIDIGLRGIPRGKDFNATTYIWMTKNILGWRNERRDDVKPASEKAKSELAKPLSPEERLALVRSVRGEKS